MSVTCFFLAQTDRCWVRHGEPPIVTVNKDGLTCAAGAGSIGIGGGERYYHGFLQRRSIMGDNSPGELAPKRRGGVFT